MTEITYRGIAGRLGRLAGPIMIGQIGVVLVSFADTFMIGHYGVRDLAAASFVNNVTMILVLAGLGFSLGLTPLISDAESKGEEIKQLYRMTAETEWRTLKLFADKWKKLAAQMQGLIPAREAKRYAEFSENLSALLGRDPGFTPPEAGEEFDPKAVIGRYVEGEEESGFNLDEVLNPKGELDLEKLCRNLGLMDE